CQAGCVSFIFIRNLNGQETRIGDFWSRLGGRIVMRHDSWFVIGLARQNAAMVKKSFKYNMLRRTYREDHHVADSSVIRSVFDQSARAK
ncbi:hypothetical protein ACE04B_20895, partial [Rhizobium phaseoli]